MINQKQSKIRKVLVGGLLVSLTVANVLLVKDNQRLSHQVDELKTELKAQKAKKSVKDDFVIEKTGYKEWSIYLKDDSQRLVPQQGKGARGVELFGYDK